AERKRDSAQPQETEKTWLVNPRRRVQKRKKRKSCRLVWRTSRPRSTTPPSPSRIWKVMSCAGPALALSVSKVPERERRSQRSRRPSRLVIGHVKPECGHSRSV